MEQFIAGNAGFIAWLLGVVGTVLVLLIGVVTWFYRRSKSQEEQAWQTALDALNSTIKEVKESLADTAHEVFGWMRSTEGRLTRLEAQHEINHRKENERG